MNESKLAGLESYIDDQLLQVRNDLRSVLEIQMQPDNVVDHKTAIWSRLKKNANAERQHMADARELWPDIAADMAKLREDYPSNAQFGAALEEHDIEYNKDDRAALVAMGKLDRSTLVDLMGRVDNTSIKWFWRIAEPQIGTVPSSPVGEHAAQSTETAPDTAPARDSGVSITDFRDSETSEPEPPTAQVAPTKTQDTPESKLIAGFERVLAKKDVKTVCNKILQLPEKLWHRVAKNAHRIHEPELGTPKKTYVINPVVPPNWISPQLTGAMVAPMQWDGSKWSKVRPVEQKLPMIEAMEEAVSQVDVLDRTRTAQTFWKKHVTDGIPLGEDYPEPDESVEIDNDAGYDGVIQICGEQVWPTDNGLTWREAAAVIMMWQQFVSWGQGFKSIADVSAEIGLLDDRAGKYLHKLSMLLKTHRDKAEAAGRNYRDIYRGPSDAQMQRSVGRIKY